MAENLTDKDALYAFEIVKTICEQVGPGLPGSSQERDRAAFIKREYEAHLGTANVTVEEFSLAPEAFISAYPLSGLFMLISALFFSSMGRFTVAPPWLTAGAALVFAILAPVIFIIQFVLYREWVDPFFKQKTSLNVIGKLRKPGSTNPKRLLMVSGHHDSAPENTWLHWLGNGFFFLTAIFFLGLLTALVLSSLQLAGILLNINSLARPELLSWLLLAFPVTPAVIFALTFTRDKKNGGTVPGAADNLSGSALTVALCRFLANNPAFIPDETEIRFLSFGSEEAGLRGSKRYVARHLEELLTLDARLLNFETVAHPVINIMTSDMNGTVRNCPEMVESVIAAAQRAKVPFKVSAAHLGVGGDAGPFSMAGLKATMLLPFKVPQQMVAFYHQPQDTPQVLTIEPLSNVLKLALEWICNSSETYS